MLVYYDERPAAAARSWLSIALRLARTLRHEAAALDHAHGSQSTPPTRGYWEQQGWSNDAFIKVNSQILAPDSREVVNTSTYTIRGLAHAGLAGVKKVEISTDNGKTWGDATLVRGPDPKNLVWTEWRFEWKVPADGRYVVMSRATTNDGVVQEGVGDSILGGTFPDGSSHIQAVTAIVKKA